MPTLDSLRPLLRRALPWVVGGLVTVAALAGVAAIVALDRADDQVQAWLAAREHRDAAWITARDRLLEVGSDAEGLAARLEASGYRRVDHLAGPGHMTVGDDAVTVWAWPPAQCGARALTLQIADGRLGGIVTEDGRRHEAFLVPGAPLRSVSEGPPKRWVPRALVPDAVARAILAAEDRRFEDHGGVDGQAVLRAAWADLRAGAPVQGGSTITQQLAKNVFLSPERSLTRKVQEAWLAMRLEAHLSKAGILEAYLNEVYFGRADHASVVGVGRAAEVYFGVSVECLGEAEGAALAAMLRSPNTLSPARHPEANRARAAVVLAAMGSDADAASLRYVDERHAASVLGAAPAAYAVDHALSQLDAPLEPGARLALTLDLGAQRAAEAALQRGLQKANARSEVTVEGALVSLDARTGEVIAHVGGSDYATTPYDRVTRAARPVGSLVKPFVALTAFEATDLEVHPRSMLFDAPVRIDQGDDAWAPNNADHRFRGVLTLRAALERSVNLPFVRLSQDLGLAPIATTLRRAGLDPGGLHPSLAVGAFEATPLAVARAYSTFLGEGDAREPRYRVTDPAQRRAVAAPRPTFLVYDMMRGVTQRGTGAAARAAGYDGEAAGKTGTSDDRHDHWFVGLDGQRVTVVWLGADQPADTGLSTGRTAVPIWADFTRSLPRAAPMASPPGLTRFPICPVSGGLAHDGCPGAAHELLPEGADVAPCWHHLELPSFDEPHVLSAAQGGAPAGW